MADTIKDQIEWAVSQLKEKSLVFQSDTPQRDAEILLAYVLGVSLTHLKTWPEKKPDIEQTEKFLSLVRKRQTGQPIAYLMGEWEFWSLPVKVSSDTLIPRPETECLVELALEKICEKKAEVADLGTGCGAIALALASENPEWLIWASDISRGALEVAKANASHLELKNINFYSSDWFSNFPDKRFDLIVSNPPYIDEEDEELESSVIQWEPQQALIAAENGLSDLKKIIVQAKGFLKAGAWLILEHGYQQGEAVVRLLEENAYGNTSTVKDLEGRDRVSCGQWLSKNNFS